MSGGFEAQRHVGAGFPEHRREPLCIFHRNDRIALARADQHAGAGKIRHRRRRQWYHRAEKDCAGEHSRAEQENGGRDVRAIGITDRVDSARIEFVFGRRGANEIGQLVRAPDDIFFIEDAFGQAPEKSRHAVLENVAARTEQGRSWIEIAAERDHVVFVSAGSMQEQKRRAAAAFLARK